MSRIAALFLDALYQVLDNWVFRILALLVLLPVLLTFVLSFQEEGVVLLFGLEQWSYETLMQPFGFTGETERARAVMIEGILGFVTSIYAGSFGLIFCLAATAFFVPRMIEKGAADVLFHKPLSRLSLYLSRYLAGLLFVALLATLLVVGMYVGLRLVSGHDDPGILWAAPSLVYLFALVHCVSMLVGVVTRSTVAATLLTVVFFFFNGCIHQVWIDLARQEIAQQASTEEAEDGEADANDPQDEPRLVRAFRTFVSVSHHLLPKTSDVDHLTAKVRRAAEGLAYADADSGLVVERLPEGFAAVGEGGGEGELEPAPSPLRAALGEALFQARRDDGARIELWRRERRTVASPRANGTERVRTERLSEAAGELVLALEGMSGVTDLAQGSLELAPREGEDAPRFAWVNAHVHGLREGGPFHYLVFREGEGSYTLGLLVPPEGAAGADATFAAVTSGVRRDPLEDPYARALRLDAEWRFNPLYSVGSSLLFAALVLLLGWARLARIDF